MAIILNLTKNVATKEQIEAGVFEPSAESKARIIEILLKTETEEVMDDRPEMVAFAVDLMAIANWEYYKNLEVKGSYFNDADEFVQGDFMQVLVEASDDFFPILEKVLLDDNAIVHKLQKETKMVKRMILNLTQHKAKDNQITEGVFEPSDEKKKVISDLITFKSCPTQEELAVRVKMLVDEATWILHHAFFEAGAPEEQQLEVMIGGFLPMMRPLEEALLAEGIVVNYSFTERVVEEIELPDGTTEKRGIFAHTGFYTVKP